MPGAPLQSNCAYGMPQALSMGLEVLASLIEPPPQGGIDNCVLSMGIFW